MNQQQHSGGLGSLAVAIMLGLLGVVVFGAVVALVLIYALK